MKIKSSLITQWSGSVAGLTGAHNQGGLYLRARAIPTNPATAAQQAIRNALSTLASRWGEVLTAAQRSAWKTYADNVPLVDTLGEKRSINAISMYQRSNAIRLYAGLDPVDDGPTEMTLPTFTAPDYTVTEGTPASIDVAFEATDDWTGEDGAALIVSASRQQSPAINYFKGPYRLAGQVDGDSSTAPTSPATISSAFEGTEDNIVFLQARLSTGDGRLSAVLRDRVTVTT